MSSEMVELQNIKKVVSRLETRVLRGFNSLGVDVMAEPGWLTVSGDEITITSLSHSLAAIIKAGKERGAPIGERPVLVKFEGSVICSLAVKSSS
jgi:hypothetical protein